VQRDPQWTEFVELSGVFFLHAMAMGAWFVPLGTVLDAHGLQAIKPLAFATGALAAFVSPLVFGAVADRHAAPARVLSALAWATALATAAVATALEWGAHPWWVLGWIQVMALCAAPTWALSTSLVLRRLTDAPRQFGPIRALGTLGWMAGCWLVSALDADASPRAPYAAACLWLLLGCLTLRLPCPPPPLLPEKLTLRQRLGWDALALLKQRDHGVVFLTAALFSVPLAAFYPYTPTYLRHLGLDHTTAWTTLGQTTEIVALFGLAAVLRRWRIKWAIAAGLGFGFLRYGLYALAEPGWVLLGLTLHGFAFTLFFITGQIYLDQRVHAEWRVRAQALFSLMTAGVGSLVGYLGAGWWFAYAQRPGQPGWPLFWGGLAAAVALVGIFFLWAYRGRGRGAR